MKPVRLNLLIAVGVVLLLATPAQNQFVKTMGGTSSDEGHSVIQTSDGGFVVTGGTESFGAGNVYLLLSKFDASGNHLWSRTLGGTSDDVGWSVVQTSDGGLVVTGRTKSFGAGYFDLLLSKFDGSGNYLWSRTLGGTSPEGGRSVVQTSDGGLVVTGYTDSFGAGYKDLLLSKFDASGNHLWSKTLGGTNWDEGYSVIQTSDGGLVVTGRTASFGAGGDDLLLSKFDASGNHLWSKTLGGSHHDQGYSVAQTSDSGLVVTGITDKYGTNYWDLLLSKFDASGNYLWWKTLRGGSWDYGVSVIQTSDGGLVVTGYTYSFGAGIDDLLLSKFDASGNHLWSRTLGGTSIDGGSSVVQTSDGGLVVTGLTYNFGAGGGDLLLSRFDAFGNTCLGEFVTPIVQSFSPTLTNLNPTVYTPSPTITSPSPTITSPTPTMTVVCEHPWIISIRDVENDQGRQVRVNWHRCSFDSVGSPDTIIEYGLWRRVYKGEGGVENYQTPLFDLEIFSKDGLYHPGDWELIKTVPATGETTYSAVCSTLVDSTQAGGMYWSVFFVRAMTPDSLVYFDCDPDSGYSLDNIPPPPISDFEINTSSWLTLQWTVPGEYVGEEPISNYDIRYNTVPVGPDTQAWWNSATACAGEGFFKLVVGEKDSFQVAEDCGCHPVVYFAIKGLDDRPNCSEISNIVRFTCGDANGSGGVDLADAVYLVNWLFIGGPPSAPMAEGDANCSGGVDLADAVYLVNWLFIGGPPPCSP